ncbi:lysylphosphatidylglycerol synthase domain-containing protein, partial [Klebsiella aerogenes]|uniref:lysylphosphatidylglycerol synthase domain-containing protein n=1 Tax=Klebsiella aerogenes TaxID=548 RepID=UPI001BD5CF0F
MLYVLLPQETTLGFTTFLAIYVLAAMLGIASNAPGGIGVFEATVLLALSSLPRNEVLTSLLLFRGCYYVVPFVTALAML